MFERRYIFQTIIFGIYARFRGCICSLHFETVNKSCILEYHVISQQNQQHDIITVITKKESKKQPRETLSILHSIILSYYVPPLRFHVKCASTRHRRMDTSLVTHRIHVWYIPYIWLMFMVFYGKCR